MEEIKVPVIDTKFCTPHALPLIVEPEKKIFTSTLFEVLDANGNHVLKIVKGNSHLKSRDILILDATDSTLATLSHKVNLHNLSSSLLRCFNSLLIITLSDLGTEIFMA